MREIRRQTGKLEQPLMTETTEASGIFGNLGDMIFSVRHLFFLIFIFEYLLEKMQALLKRKR